LVQRGTTFIESPEKSGYARSVRGICWTAGILASLALAAEPDVTGVAPPPAAVTSAATSTVWVIPLRGPIEPALLYIVRRGAREAAKGNVSAVVFVMDTPGGQLDAAEGIIRQIQGIRVPTYTWVERHAFSAGALIALATKKIYMAPGSLIGDALPIMVVPLLGPQEMPDDLKEKIVAATAAIARSAAEQAGHDPAVAEAMVRADMELKIDGEVIKPAGRLLTLTAEEARRPVGPNRRPLLSAGTVCSLEELLAVVGLAGAQVRELRVTSAERLARWIQALSWLFLLVGIGGIYIEVKTPGFGLPGTIGILALAIFFWGHHVAGLAGYEDLALIVLGVVLLAVELWLPGFGIFGMLGTLLLVAGVILTMSERPLGGGWWPEPISLRRALGQFGAAVAGTAVLIWAIQRWFPRTRAYHALVLTASTSRTQGFTSSHVPTDLLGQTGVALSDLRPAGIVRLGDSRLDVVTDGEFVPAGTRVRVVHVDGFRVVVEPLPNTEGGSPT